MYHYSFSITILEWYILKLVIKTFNIWFFSSLLYHSHIPIVMFSSMIGYLLKRFPVTAAVKFFKCWIQFVPVQNVKNSLQQQVDGSHLLNVAGVLKTCPLFLSCFAVLEQHTTMMSNSKSYVCPVCGRALSSPGSLGRHLLIHSEDRLSNCAVCGARFTDTNNFNRFASSLL